MVDFGPRLTGSQGHDRFVEWLRREFVAAGTTLLPCDDYAYERWSVGRFGLDVLDGAAPAAVKVATYYTRSQETPEEGVDGPLVYGGTMPVPSINTDPAATAAAVASYPDEVASWAAALPSALGGSPDGAILVVDLPLPAPLTAGAFLPIASYLYWPGHTEADWLGIDYKRTWILPGLGVPLAPFAGARGSGRGLHRRPLVGGAGRATTCRSTTAMSRCRRCTSTATRGGRCATRGPRPDRRA